MEFLDKPDPSDCCNSGCNPCILDAYEQKLKDYEERGKLQINKRNCMSEVSYTVFKLSKIEKHTKYTFFYTFEFLRPLKGEIIDLEELAVLYTPGQHFLLKASVEDREFTRAYTPLFNENLGRLEFMILIKLYEQGRMSNYLRNLKIAEETLWRGPYGDYIVDYTLNNLFLVSQGTGITPIYDIICDILLNEGCYTFLNLFFCCDCENILLRNELYKLSDYWNFKYTLFVNNNGNKFEKKYKEVVEFKKLDQGFVKECISGVKGSFRVLICGSESFCNIIKQCFLTCNVEETSIFVF